MNTTFYNGVSGMIAHQKDLDVLSHNMSNVNTVGYKATRSSFDNLLYNQLDANEKQNLLTGHGVKVSSIDLLFKQGILNSTYRDLDFALFGDGFFCIDRGGGEREYTRDGNFNIGTDGNKKYLVTADGGYVLDNRGQRIKIEYQKDKKTVIDLPAIQEKIGIYHFSNPFGLLPIENSCFLETEVSGEATVMTGKGKNAEKTELINGALELSTVDLTQAMADVIQAQKAFKFNAKLVQTADQIEEIINNLK